MNPLGFFKKNNDRDIAAQIKAATHITMDDTSRERMRANLFEYAKMRPVRERPANQCIPQSRLVTFLRAHSIPAIAGMLVLAVSGGTAAAAEGALPGDILYPVKVHINEEVQATLAITPKAKADWAVSRAGRRLEEAATLALAGKLDDTTRAVIDTNLDEHVRSAGESRQRLEDENSPDASEIGTDIGAIAIARDNIVGTRSRNARKTPMLAEIASDTATMSASIELHTEEKASEPRQADESETTTRGHRKAAKARIDATKKFLDHAADGLGRTTREHAETSLKAATEAFSSGDDDDAHGNKEEASSNFNSALEAATEIETLISVSNEKESNDSGDEKSDENGALDSSGSNN